jgi:probable rRNA maturation factor
MSSTNRSLTPNTAAATIDVPISIELAAAEDPEPGGAAAELANPTPTTPPPVDAQLQQQIQQAVRVAAQSQGFHGGQIGVLVTDDATIHQINLRHLQHDYPTDVISFDYHRGDCVVQGELVVSLCAAQRTAQELQWDWRSELLLYVIHGTLHICGLEDSTAAQQQQMRAAEQAALLQLGITDSEPLGRGFAGEPCPDNGAVER